MTNTFTFFKGYRTQVLRDDILHEIKSAYVKSLQVVNSNIKHEEVIYILKHKDKFSTIIVIQKVKPQRANYKTYNDHILPVMIEAYEI